jgi:hypothetical protein
MFETRSETTTARVRYAEVMNQCQDMVVIFSNAQLTELFEHTGAALLDFAERAENNTMQGRFFEAMGLIQRRRADIEHIFRHEINLGFENFGNIASMARGQGDNNANTEGADLSLVEHDEMEESVAAENLIIKANANYFPELYALSQRLTIINGGKKLKDHEIPAGPHHLVHSFRRSMDGLDLEVRIKVILYALFDKFVIKHAKSLYDELNGNLRDAGILPNLKPVHVRSAQSPGKHDGGPQRPPQTGESEYRGRHAQADVLPDSQEAASLGSELFESIIELMSTRQVGRHGPARRRQAPSTPTARAAAASASRDLVAAIGRVQSSTTPESVHSMVVEAAEIPNLEVDTAFIDKVKETLTQEREQVLSQIDRDKLSPMDADLIDLIGMLFEYMLNDPVLPNLAKALLSHLHTPYLKVALIDRRLLVDARHPARRLLDQMVEAGSLWVDENNPQRGIFPSMQRVVDRVLQEFVEDVALFEELLASFEQSMNEQQRRADTMEQRTQKAARGREKLQLAKRRANHQIQDLLQRRSLPQPVISFLSKTWLDQLVFILLRDKDEDRSDAWKQAVQNAEDLVDLFEPDLGAAGLRARTDMIPKLREHITQGVQRMGSYTHSALDALFVLLDSPETWHELRQEAAVEEQASPAAPTSEQVPITLFPAHEDSLAAQGQISEQEQNVIKRLRKMKFGTWFELTSETGGAPRRIKLSWLSPLTSTCMFVDRSGMQAEIKTLQELAQEILSGRAKVIPRPKHPFIERALVSIRKMLQGGEEQASSEASHQR